MSLKNIGEFGFIERIRRGCVIQPRGIAKAIGDDAAAFRTEAGHLTLVTTDLLVERVHFLRDATSGYNLGYKALAVNLSDIAAMGGTAGNAFVSIAIPEDCTLDYLEDIYRGMKSLAAQHDVNILGGDTTGSARDLIINLALTGTVLENEVLYRDAARAGDVILSDGFLGDSRAGLHLLLNRIKADKPYLKALLNAHLLPRPSLHEGRFLACRPGVHAAIDVSDGLSSDLGHILHESKVGARLFSDRIPLSPALEQFCRQFGFDPVEYALAGGEDYTLLLTVDPAAADGLVREFSAAFQRPLYRIGDITDKGILERVETGGNIRTVVPTGWNHFKKES
jgi:thiamine-monophosphate kinase